jgi:integrase
VPSFKDLCEAYITNHIRAQFNPAKPQRTARSEYHVRWFMRPQKREGGNNMLAGWLDRPLTDITEKDVLAVKNACGDKRHLANRLCEFIRAVYNWSNEHFWKVANPAIGVKAFPEKKRERFLQPDEAERFNECLKTETNQDLKDILTLALSCAARHSDIFAARWEDVHWEREVWNIPYPKNGEAYHVQLLPVALLVFERRKSEAVDGAVFVFPGVGKSGHLMDLKKQWQAFRKCAGLKNYRFHDLRHTTASFMAIAGVPLQQIGAALGHKSLQSTMRYAHLIDSAVRDGREAGQAKMVELMEASKKRAELAASKKTPRAALTA